VQGMVVGDCYTGGMNSKPTATELLISFCAKLYRHRLAANWAKRAVAVACTGRR